MPTILFISAILPVQVLDLEMGQAITVFLNVLQATLEILLVDISARKFVQSQPNMVTQFKDYVSFNQAVRVLISMLMITLVSALLFALPVSQPLGMHLATIVQQIVLGALLYISSEILQRKPAWLNVRSILLSMQIIVLSTVCQVAH
jgi:hypothetical protein